MKNNDKLTKRLFNAIGISDGNLNSFLTKLEKDLYSRADCSVSEAILFADILESKGTYELQNYSSFHDFLLKINKLNLGVVTRHPSKKKHYRINCFTIAKDIKYNTPKKITVEKKSKPTVINFDKDGLQSRLDKVINSSNDTEGIIQTFDALCVPFDKKSERKDLYLSIFHSVGIKDAYWDKKMGLIVPAKKSLQKTIVSHMDLINLFNKGFRKGRTITENDGVKLKGALDNTITNATLITSILRNRNENTAYLFTLDEETTQYAIRDYMKKFGTEQFVINLDVTDVGISYNGEKEADVSVEFDEPSWEICKQLKKSLTNPSIQKERECDDFDEVVRAGGYGFSYCIPTGGTIHSYKNWCYISSIEPYYNGLNFLIHELDVSKKDKNIKNISILDALSCETLDELKEKNKAPKRSFRDWDYDMGFNQPNFPNINFEVSGDTHNLFYEEYETETNEVIELHVDFITKVLPNVDSDLIWSNVNEKGEFNVIEDTSYIQDEHDLDRYCKALEFLEQLGILSEDIISGENDDMPSIYNVEYEFDYSTKYMRLLFVLSESAPHLDLMKFHEFYQESETIYSSDLHEMFFPGTKDGTLHSELIDLVHAVNAQNLQNQDEKTLNLL